MATTPPEGATIADIRQTVATDAQAQEEEQQEEQEPKSGLFYDTDAENVTPELLNEWLGTTKDIYQGNVALRNALFRYSGQEQPTLYQTSQRMADRNILEAAGLLVDGQLGGRSLDRYSTTPDYGRYGTTVGMKDENVIDRRGNIVTTILGRRNRESLWDRAQQDIYSDLLAERAAQQPGGPPLPTATMGTATSGFGPVQRTMGPQNVRDLRRATTMGGRPSPTSRYRMAGNLAGLTAINPEARARSQYDPYRETWYEWGNEIVGSSKRPGERDIWTAKDLGIQY